jgi:hypothetical protein
VSARVVVAALLMGSAAGGCGVSVEGDFDGVAFAPVGSVQAVLDANDVLVRDGALVPVQRTRLDRRVHLWLSSASLPVDEAWRTLPGTRLLDVRKQLATSDLLVLQNIDFDALQDGDRLTASNDLAIDDGLDGSSGSGDFRFAVSQQAEANVDAGLGALVTVSIQATKLEVGEPRGGQLDATVVVKRARASSQPDAGIASGEVTLRLSLGLAPERVAEANLATVAPIALCAARLGADASAACLDAGADEVLDDTGAN